MYESKKLIYFASEQRANDRAADSCNHGNARWEEQCSVLSPSSCLKIALTAKLTLHKMATDQMAKRKQFRGYVFKHPILSHPLTRLIFQHIHSKTATNNRHHSLSHEMLVLLIVHIEFCFHLISKHF